jgi:hypothetical protein
MGQLDLRDEFLETLTVAQLVITLPSRIITQMFTTVFTRAIYVPIVIQAK